MSNIDRLGLFLVAAAVASSLPNAARAGDWSGHGLDLARSRSSVEQSGAAFDDGRWTFSLPGGVVTVSSPAVADDKVVFGAFDGVIRAIDASDGKPRWEHRVGDAVYAAPAIDAGRVFVAAVDKRIYALRLSDGATIWSKDLGGLSMGAPAVVDGSVIIAAGFPQRLLFKLSAATGRTVWQTPLGAMAQFSNSAVAVGGDSVVVGANGGHYYNFDLQTGALRWTYEAGGVVNLSAPVVIDRRAYFLPGGSSELLHAVDLDTGRPLPGWPIPLGLPAPDVDGQALSRQISVSSLTAAGQRLVLDVRVDDSLDTNKDKTADRYLSREYLMAVEANGAAIAWRQANGRTVFADPNDVPKFWLCPTPVAYGTAARELLVATASTLMGSLRIIDVATGTDRWSAPVSAPSQASPVLANGQLVVATTNGIQGFLSSVNHPPSTPSLLEMAGRRVASFHPTLFWAPATDPDHDSVSYTIRIDRDDEVLDTWEREVSVGPNETSVRWPDELRGGAIYTVAARARDAQGALSAWSETVAIETDAQPPIIVDGRSAGSLSEAVTAMAGGNVVDLGPGTFRLGAPIDLPPGTILRGSGAGATVLDGSGLEAGLRLGPTDGTRPVQISGLTVQHARIGVALQGTKGARLVNVILRDNTEAGVDVGIGADADLVNATLVRNEAAVRSGGAIRVRNSIIARNHAAYAVVDGGSISSRYNDLYANTTDSPAVATGVGDLSTEVTFADEARDDFHVSYAQATTDSGDPADAVGEEPTPHGGRVNLGAFGGTAEAERSRVPSTPVVAVPAGAAPDVTNGSASVGPPTEPRGGCSVAGNGGPGTATTWLAAVALGLLARRRRRGGAVAATLMVLLGAGRAQAATMIWGGGTGTWGTAANWIGGATPGSSDTASFGGWVPIDRTAWIVTSSVGSGQSSVKDGKWNTRWTTGTNAASGQWLKIDLGSTQTFARIVLDDTGDGSDYPPAYDVFVSSDGSTWGSAIASGTGSAPLTTISFADQTARYIKVQLTNGASHWWSNREAFVYSTASTDDTQLARNGWTASASLNGNSAALAIDSALSTRWDTGANVGNGDWFKVDMGAQASVDRVDFNAYTSNNDYPPSYTVALSTDDSSYTTVASGSPSAAFVSATFTARSARYIKITCTSAGSYYFSIHDFNVYGTPRAATVTSSASVGAITLAKGTITQGSGATLTMSGAYTQTGGTLTGGDSAISAGSLAVSGGTFASTTGTLTISGTFNQTGGTFSAATGNVSCSSTASAATVGTNGSYTVGAGTHTFAGGLTVGAGGTLTMATSGGTVAIGSGKTLTIDGTLNANSTNAVVHSAGSVGTFYAFKVGSTASARPTLNLTGLTVMNTDTNGMWINADTGASTTFTRFDNVHFSKGTGTRLLRIYASNLYLSSTGCTFDGGADSGTTSYNVTLTGNGTGDGDTRAIFGDATCATDKTPCASHKQDDDAGNGTGTSPSTNGAVAQFIAACSTDTAGTVIGFPTAAIDWNTFAHYSVYVPFHAANGTADRIFVRDEAGESKYLWEAPSGDSIIGTPRWETVGGVHYLYVATVSGKVYRLIDNTVGLTLTPDSAAPWNGTYFDCGCTIATPLTIDTNNLYWAGTASGVPKLWTLGKTTRTQPAGSPLATSASAGSAAPAIWTSGDTYVFLGMPGRISKVDVTTQSNVADNTNPGGMTGVNGRITILGSTLFAGDDNGYLWALDPGDNFAASSGTYKRWSYHDAANHSSCGGVCAIKNLYRDASLGRVYYGDQDGHVYVVNDAASAVTGFPFRPGTASESFTTSPLYRAGVIVIGSSTGMLYFIDQNADGSSPAVIQTYKFGATTQISSVAYDNSTNRYLVSTADPTAKDGKIYYIAAVADPTPTHL
jgi:MYXO-CTERM domain-containing protein